MMFPSNTGGTAAERGPQCVLLRQGTELDLPSSQEAVL